MANNENDYWIELKLSDTELEEKVYETKTIPLFKVLNKIQVYKYKYDNANSEIEATQYAAIITVLESLI